MSRFKNEVQRLQEHVKTLRQALGAMFIATMLCGAGWWSAPSRLTISVPPDLRSGSTRKWWDVPPESVYTFTLYAWQQIQRWPANGEDDYPRNLRAYSPYMTPACHAFLLRDFQERRDNGELRQRERGIYEIPGRGYGDDPERRVRTVSADDWVVTLDVSAEESLGAERVKRAFVRYALKVVRWDVDPKLNPFGLALDCYAGPPLRIETPPASAPSGPSTSPLGANS